MRTGQGRIARVHVGQEQVDGVGRGDRHAIGTDNGDRVLDGLRALLHEELEVEGVGDAAETAHRFGLLGKVGTPEGRGGASSKGRGQAKAKRTWDSLWNKVLKLVD